MPGAQHDGHELLPMEEQIRGMELQEARRYGELKKENRELKTILADSLLKIRVLEEVNAKKW